ncbi:MAG: DUF2334 domain-containing protein [Thiotrichaceae bacterium]
MKFIIRDDDTCALTKPEELEKCYGFLRDNAPVCLSVTPFRIPGKIWDIDEKLKNVPQSLETNQELLAYLRDQINEGRVDIAMHGYHHVSVTVDLAGNIVALPDYDNPQRPWWREYLYGNGLGEKTSYGKKYLEQQLHCKVSTFVPPGNAISKQGLRAIIGNQLNLVGSPGLGHRLIENRPFDPLSFMNAIKRKLWKMRHNKQTKYPYVYNFSGGHKEIDYYTLNPSTDINDLKQQIDFVHAVDGIFVLGIHYHAFSSKLQSGKTIEYGLHTLIDHLAQKDNVEYISYRELWKSTESPSSFG